MSKFTLCIVVIGCLNTVQLAFSQTSLLTTVNSVASSANNYSNGASNALCEKTPTHLLCNASVKSGHKVLQNLPAASTIRHCSVFVASPHCCKQFCLPGIGGNCDYDTGACFCGPAGVPSVCELIMRTDDTPPALLNNNDNAVMDICRDKCKLNPNGCTRPAATTDGIVGTVCMCYCDPPGNTTTTTAAPTIPILTQ